MSRISDWLQTTLGFSAATQGKLLLSIIAIGLLWSARRILLSLVRRQVQDVRVQYRWKKFSAYLFFAVGVVVLVRVWLGGFQSMATYFGLLSAGVAIALRDPLVNLAGWAFILWRRPFSVGDRIEIGAIAGDVIDQRIFQFSLMEVGNWVAADQSTGRVIHIPNGQVFTHPLANYTSGFDFIWNEIPVLVTFESDWRKAKDLLSQIVAQHSLDLSDSAAEQVRKAARRYLIFYSKLTPIVYTSVADSGVLLTMRYLCDPRRRRSTAELIWEEILQEFSQHPDIDFAYPTRRLFDHRSEGKTAGLAQELHDDAE